MYNPSHCHNQMKRLAKQRTEDDFNELYNSVNCKFIKENICVEKQSQNDFIIKTNKKIEVS